MFFIENMGVAWRQGYAITLLTRLKIRLDFIEIEME